MILHSLPKLGAAVKHTVHPDVLKNQSCLLDLVTKKFVAQRVTYRGRYALLLFNYRYSARFYKLNRAVG
jgi:hypothetical protein